MKDRKKQGFFGTDRHIQLCAEGSKPRSAHQWKKVTSGLPQDSVLGLVLINIFVSSDDLGEGMQEALFESVDGTQLGEVDCSSLAVFKGRFGMATSQEFFSCDSCTVGVWILPNSTIL